ncbi:MAG TPA: hypothetical protein PK800_02970, partial [Syntrophorhabdaceae bacterium]|nr:hypothetical protein [Syntrophorhabdaceae bacterium]
KIEKVHEILKSVRLRPTKQTEDMLKNHGLEPIKNPMTLEELLKKPDVTIGHLKGIEERIRDIEEDVAYQVELNVKYHGYKDRQIEIINRAKRLEEKKIPQHVRYEEVPGLSREIVEKLSRIRPLSLGQASRIPGVTPAAITALMIYFKKTGVFK